MSARYPSSSMPRYAQHEWSAAQQRPGFSGQAFRTIRVSNLAPSVTEDELHRIFSQFGNLTDVWIAVDTNLNRLNVAYLEFQETGKVEFAVKQFNNVPLKGLPITIEPALDHWKEQRNQINRAVEERSRPQHTASTVNSSNQETSENMAAANLSSEQMFNLMHQMKLCIEADPVRARDALLKNFTLSAGMLQALLMMKLLDPAEAWEVLSREEKPTTATSTLLPPPNVQVPPPGHQPHPSLNAVHHQAHVPGYPVTSPQMQPVPQSYAAAPLNMMTDPRQARGVRPPYGGPPPRGYPPAHSQPHVSQQQTPPSSSQAETEHAAILMQLVQMTDQQLAALEPEQRQAVYLLRQQLGMQA